MRRPLGIDEFLARFRRHVGFSMTDGDVIGVSVRLLAPGKMFAHLLSEPSKQRGWAAPIEPIRFFSRRVIIPEAARDREIEFIRYNRPDLIPLPEAHSIILRFLRNAKTGETLLHGIRDTRLAEFLEDCRKDGRVSASGAPSAAGTDRGRVSASGAWLESGERMPTIDGVVPPAVALASAIRAARPNLAGKTLAVLVGARTTRYLALRDGILVNVFDDTHRPDQKNALVRFRKTLQRVIWHMEGEGLGGVPDRILLMGDPAARVWADEIQKTLEGSRIEFFDLLGEAKLVVPSGVHSEMAILALGAAIASADPDLSDFNFIGLPRSVAARRFDAYDLVIYGSLAVMVALSFITLNSVIAERIRSVNDDLRTDAGRVLDIREEVESKRGVVPVAQKLLQFAENQTPDASRVGQRIAETLPEFLALLSETIPDGVRLDKVGSGNADLTDKTPRAYQSILPRTNGLMQVTLTGQTRSPEKAVRWVESLAAQLQTPVVMEEMASEGADGTYHFRIAITSGGEKNGA